MNHDPRAAFATTSSSEAEHSADALFSTDRLSPDSHLPIVMTAREGRTLSEVLPVVRQLECDQPADAVAEQSERPVKTGLDGLGELGDQAPEFADRRFFHPGFSSRQLHGADFDLRREILPPMTKDRRPSSRVGNT